MTTNGWLKCEGQCNSLFLLPDGEGFEKALLSNEPIICSSCNPVKGLQPELWGSGAMDDVSPIGPIPSRKGPIGNNDLARESMIKIATKRQR